MRSDKPDPNALISERCTVCHSLDRIDGAVKSREGWERTVEVMRSRGARLSDAEAEAVVTYLAERDAKR